MLSVAPIHHLTAQENSQLPDSIKDSEAFFLFLANSIEDEGNLITPMDLEAFDLEDRTSEQGATKENESSQTLSQRQEEAL